MVPTILRLNSQFVPVRPTGASSLHPEIRRSGSHQKRGDVVGAEALYKKARAIDPFHANSIYNYAVLLDSSLKQQEVRIFQLLLFVLPKKEEGRRCIPEEA